MSLSELGVAAAAAEIREGRITSADLVRACLARIDEADGKVQAWAHLDRDHALRQAEALDELRRAGKPTGPLHGVPLGIKDIFDTGDYPTELGSPIWAGRTPRRDAAAVARLRAAGAVIMGKTVTAEYAYFHPGKTANPCDPSRTPGGSSSGSAAAVGAQMVPGAIGTQTAGSTIRPAAYCGVVGFKPTHGLIPRTGCLMLSRALDHVGIMARSVEDVALLAEVMTGHDEDDPDTRPIARPPFAAMAASDPPLPPRLAFVRTPAWTHIEPAMSDAFAELIEALGAISSDTVTEVELSEGFARAADFHAAVMSVEMAHNLHRDYETGAAQMSAKLREIIERGRKRLALEYTSALAAAAPLNAALEEIFDEFDAIVTPPQTGEAPKGLGATGSPAFCTLWTYLGVPAITLPLMESEAGMPLGVQLVGRRGGDARLLRTARWLAATLANPARSRVKRPTPTPSAASKKRSAA